jgi:2-oxoglutarate ferredoxin oxidoreductase subunit delta
VTVVDQGDGLTELSDKFIRQPMNLDTAQVPEGRVHVIAERCKECNFCITYCPTEVLAYSEDTNAKGYRYPEVADGKEHSCVLCRFCDMICPELAIFTTDSAQQEEGGEPDDG